MKQRSYWIIGIIIIIGLILIGVYYITKPETNGGDVLLHAPQVFSSNTTINSEQDVKNLIISNSNKIMEGTLNLYQDNLESRYPKNGTDKKIIDSVNNEWQFNNSEVELKDCCVRGFWAGNIEDKLYTVTILSSNIRIVRPTIICNDPAEQPATNEETGKANCGSGIKEEKIVDVSPKLIYLIDNSGEVYFAGVYTN